MNGKFKFGLVALVVAIALLFMSAGDAISFFKSAIKVDVDNVTDLKKGDHVIIDVALCYGASISETSVTKDSSGKVKSSTESSRYYIIPYLYESNGYTESYDLTVKVNKKDFNYLETAYDQTVEYYQGTIDDPEVIITFEGIVDNMNKDEKKYTEDFYYEAFGVKSVFDSTDFVQPIYVRLPVKAASYGLFFAGIIALALGILFVVLGLKQGSVQKANRQALVNANYYTAPQNVTFNNDPNAPAQPQAPPQRFDPYGVANDPRFANLQHNAANPQAPANVTFNNAPAQAQATVNNAAQQVTTIPNEVPAVPDPVEVSPITPLSPIEPMNNGDQNNI